MSGRLPLKTGISLPLHGSRFAHVRIITTLASGALLGKALGFVRELLLARVFGASYIADGFRGSVSAVTLPVLPFMGESVCAILIPMHRNWQEEGDAPAKLAALCMALGLAATFIMLIVEAGASWWVRLIVGGMSAEGQSLVLNFVRLMALWMPACVILNCLTAAEIASGRARIAGLMPTVMNVSMIGGIFAYVATGELRFLPLLFAASFNALSVWSLRKFFREGMLEPAGVRLSAVMAAGAFFSEAAAYSSLAARRTGPKPVRAAHRVRVCHRNTRFHWLCPDADKVRHLVNKLPRWHGGVT